MLEFALGAGGLLVALVLHHYTVVRPLIETLKDMRYVGFNHEPRRLPSAEPARPEVVED